METLSRRINSKFGTLTSLRGRNGSRVSSSSSPSPSEDINHLSTLEGPASLKMDQQPVSKPLLVHVPSSVGHSRSASGASAQSVKYLSNSAEGSAAAASSRSLSMNSVSSEGSIESHLVEQEEIVALTHDIRSFKEALGKLRRIFQPERDKKREAVRVSAHERLGEVLRILRTILERYPPLRSTELLTAAGLLIQQVKSYNYEDAKNENSPVEVFETIDQLALAFSSRVSEYLMGDIDISSAIGHPTATTIRSRSCENLLPGEFDSSAKDHDNKLGDGISPEEIDDCLMKMENGIHLAFHRAKLWSKYAKDIINYIDKRSTLELEFSKSLVKLAQHMRPIFKEDSFLPFQSVYCTALDKDIENANVCQVTSTCLQEQKFVEPLSARRTEHEKQRKQLKELWQRELKKTQEAVVNLRKARAQYIQRNQEYEKARDSVQKAENSEVSESGAKMEKKKRTEEDASQKVIDAEAYYKTCVAQANERHETLEKTKAYIIRTIRELMLQGDQTLKAVTVCYFQMKQTVAAPAPVQFQTLCECSRVYEPGSQYMEYVKRLPVPPQDVNAQETSNVTPFSFEPYSPELRLNDRERKSNDSCDVSEVASSSTVENKDGPPISPGKVWTGTATLGSDSDSVGSSQSNKSRDTSPSASPQAPTRKVVSSHASSGDELDADMDVILENGYGTRRTMQSKAAQTHTFRKLRTLAKCRECDSYVYFQGVECSQCILACHKKCLESLAIQCGHKKLPRKMNTFGVDLCTHVQETRVEVPHLVSRCISEIEKRGLNVKGIYRVSGVKSKVEKLCQSFENGANLVDLSEVHPSVIANVLKLYLRELPEPLLAFRLYPELIRIAKEWQVKAGDEDSEIRLLNEIKELISKLPPAHRATLALLMNHLKIISETPDNNMPPSNLGIVFGPTLLRATEGASLTSLVDTVHQAKVVEILIQHPEVIDGMSPLRTDSGILNIDRELVNGKKTPLSNCPSKSLDELALTVSEPVASSQSTSEINLNQSLNDSLDNSSFVRSGQDVGTEAITTDLAGLLVMQPVIGNVEEKSAKQSDSVDDIRSNSSHRHLSKSKSVQAIPCAGVATQTDLSFLRTLAASSPVPTPRKHGGSLHHKSSLSSSSSTTPKVPHSISPTALGNKRGSTAGDVPEKVVLHVAAAVNLPELKSETVVLDGEDDKSDSIESSSLEVRSPINLNIQNQFDQTDSGFEDTKHSPECSPVSYVSMYLCEDPYKRHRMQVGASGNKLTANVGSPSTLYRSNSIIRPADVKTISITASSPTNVSQVSVNENQFKSVPPLNSSDNNTLKISKSVVNPSIQTVDGSSVLDLSDEDEDVDDYILSNEQHFV
ncbi:Rho GTPase-activating protein 45 [Cleaved into: Minor histocompatibility antigen HA-1 [Chamberlinius hualienensis]